MSEFDAQRRLLLQGLALATASGALVTSPIRAAASNAQDWEKVRTAYAPAQPYMNLNNAAVSPSPLVVQDAVFKAYRFANTEPDVNMWDGLDAALPGIKKKLAALADCDVAEIAINRNSTEGLCTAIFGIRLGAGDEVLLGEWD